MKETEKVIADLIEENERLKETVAEWEYKYKRFRYKIVKYSIEPIEKDLALANKKVAELEKQLEYSYSEDQIKTAIQKIFCKLNPENNPSINRNHPPTYAEGEE
jgi:hypothetical protein